MAGQALELFNHFCALERRYRFEVPLVILKEITCQYQMKNGISGLKLPESEVFIDCDI
jgi:hypothetical protein